jgi:hypothetical protein
MPPGSSPPSARAAVALDATAPKPELARHEQISNVVFMMGDTAVCRASTARAAARSVAYADPPPDACTRPVGVLFPPRRASHGPTLTATSQADDPDCPTVVVIRHNSSISGSLTDAAAAPHIVPCPRRRMRVPKRRADSSVSVRYGSTTGRAHSRQASYSGGGAASLGVDAGFGGRTAVRLLGGRRTPGPPRKRRAPAWLLDRDEQKPHGRQTMGSQLLKLDS